MFVDWIVVALYVGYHSKASRLIVAVAKGNLRTEFPVLEITKGSTSIPDHILGPWPE